MHYCHDCRLVEVDHEFTFCPSCLHDWEIWLEKEWQHTLKMRQMEFRRYLTQENIEYTTACYVQA